MTESNSREDNYAEPSVQIVSAEQAGGDESIENEDSIVACLMKENAWDELIGHTDMDEVIKYRSTSLPGIQYYTDF